MNNYQVKVLAAFSLSLFGASAVRANVITSCTPGTLDTYIDGVNSNCMQASGNTAIFNYGFAFGTQSTSDLSDTAGNIYVTPNSNGTLSFGAGPGGTPRGFTNLPSGSNENLAYFIGYNIDPPPIIDGDTIGLAPFNDAILSLFVCNGSVNGGTITGTPYFQGNIDGIYTCGSTPNPGGGTSTDIMNSPFQSTISELCEGCGDPMATVNFPLTSQVGLLLVLQLFAPPSDVPGGSGNGTFANTNNSAVPEPSSLLTLGSAAAAILLRKFLSKRLRAR